MKSCQTGLLLLLAALLVTDVTGSQSVIYKKINITMMKPPVLLKDNKHSAGHLSRPLGPILTREDLEGHNPLSMNDIPRRAECRLRCKYGREVDMEGREMCKCRLAPCKRIECPQGMKCLVKKFCEYGVCDDKPYCEVENTCKLAKPNNFYFGCSKLTKRFYFDAKRGKCRRFWGCKEIDGNNFANKKECKRTCYKRRGSKKLGGAKADSRKVQVAQKKVISDNAIPVNPLTLGSRTRLGSRSRGASKHRSYVTAAPRPLHQKCPSDNPYEKCPEDPCSKCSNSKYVCFRSFCGKCQVIFINLQTGHSVTSADEVCGPEAAKGVRVAKER